MCWLVKSQPPSPTFTSNWKWYLAAGVSSGLGHVLITLVGHMHRTPRMSLHLIRGSFLEMSSFFHVSPCDYHVNIFNIFKIFKIFNIFNF